MIYNGYLQVWVQKLNSVREPVVPSIKGERVGVYHMLHCKRDDCWNPEELKQEASQECTKDWVTCPSPARKQSLAQAHSPHPLAQEVYSVSHSPPHLSIHYIGMVKS